MPRVRPAALTVGLSIFFLFAVQRAWASLPGEPGVPGSLPEVLIALAVILLAAKLGGTLAERLRQPAVLGELMVGIVLGNLALFGWQWFDTLTRLDVIRLLAELGVIILLFQVGIESDIRQMARVGASSLLVAMLGVVGPFFLGWGAGAWFYPDASVYLHIFLGAILTATSVGITARVLQDIHKLDTNEGRIILGAAVLDDVLGLVILAALTGIIQAANAGQSVSSLAILWLVTKAMLFLSVAVIASWLLYKPMFRVASYLRVQGMLLIGALTACFVVAFVAAQVGLAPIIGAFAAGLVLDEAHYRDYETRGRKRLDDLLEPLALFLIPIFFVKTGMDVDLSAIGQGRVLLFALVLTVAAIIGKQLSGFGVVSARRQDVNRWIVGLGMIPRGEVGLIFASVGLGLTFQGQSVVSSDVYSAVVIMVALTTMATPPMLAWAFRRKGRAPKPPRK